MLLPLLLLPIALVAGFAAALTRRFNLTVGINEHADVVAVHRRSSAWRIAGVLAGIGVAGALTFTGVLDLGRGPLLAPSAFGVMLLAAVCVGQVVEKRPMTLQRTATLDTRRPADVVPRTLSTIVGLGLALYAGVLAIGLALGKTDDLGRVGRVIAATCRTAADGSVMSSTQGPWPGSYYVWPLAALLLGGLLLSALTLLAIVHRPRPSAESAAIDAVLRRLAGRQVVLAIAVLGFGSLAPIAGVMSSQLLELDCAPSSYGPLGIALAVISALAVGIGAWCLGGLLVGPRLTVDDLPPASPADPTSVPVS
jgi:hypothetical protein